MPPRQVLGPTRRMPLDPALGEILLAHKRVDAPDSEETVWIFPNPDTDSSLVAASDSAALHPQGRFGCHESESHRLVYVSP